MGVPVTKSGQLYQQTFESYVKGSVIQLNAAGLPNGNYIVNVIGKQINWSNKLVIVR